MSFDRIEHNDDLLHKIKFYIIYGKLFFLLIPCLEVDDYELPKCTSSTCTIKPGMRQDSILIHLFFFYFNCLPDDALCKTAI